MSIPLIVALASLAAGPPPAPACPSAEEKPDVVALVKRTEQLMDGKSSVATMSMQIKTPAWSRKLKLKVTASGKDYALIRILEGGPREVGMGTLKREKQLWNYLPQAGRVMKLPSGMMGDSWLGSDFTNDDLVKGSSITDDFTSTVDGTVEQDGRQAWKVTLVPRLNAVVVWGKVEMVVDRKLCVPLVQRFYDEQGKLARTLAFGDIKKVGWRDFPHQITVTPSESGRETTLTYEDVSFDVDVPESTFSINQLQNRK
ncbi:MAG TPA: outer membrane lipoprotein-sorting protein [Myxococcales bacterium]|nr:outer membrane lipoprotein-sorting protein [Myxococcales bacterium]